MPFRLIRGLVLFLCNKKVTRYLLSLCVMRKRKRWNPELIVAMLAVAIGVCTMFVYIYQARIMSKQIQASTWPYLEVNFTNTGSTFSINVKNKGAGPAIVKNAAVRVNNVSYPDTHKSLDSVAYLLTGARALLNGYTNIDTRVISAGEVIHFIEINDSTSVDVFLKALRKQPVELEICYCSVFDECWTVAGGKVEPCDACVRGN